MISVHLPLVGRLVWPVPRSSVSTDGVGSSEVVHDDSIGSSRALWSTGIPLILRCNSSASCFRFFLATSFFAQYGLGLGPLSLADGPTFFGIPGRLGCTRHVLRCETLRVYTAGIALRDASGL
jgi:hypothetical protein